MHTFFLRDYFAFLIKHLNRLLPSTCINQLLRFLLDKAFCKKRCTSNIRQKLMTGWLQFCTLVSIRHGHIYRLWFCFSSPNASCLMLLTFDQMISQECNSSHSAFNGSGVRPNISVVAAHELVHKGIFLLKQLWDSLTGNILVGETIAYQLILVEQERLTANQLLFKKSPKGKQIIATKAVNKLYKERRKT